MTTSPSSAVVPDLVTVAGYGTYAEAQRAVDHLSDQRFPVLGTLIIGVGLQLVEHVLARLTYPRAAATGAGAGVWFGLLFGLFLSFFTVGAISDLAIILWAVLWGAIACALFAVISYALTGGTRDFVSESRLVADRYEVRVIPEHAERARELLAGLNPTGR
jgi:hypothetical protein